MAKPKCTEKGIQYKLAQELIRRRHDLVLPNVQLNWGECDLVSVTAAGYVNEWEIKCSRSDFKADFKKRKHRNIEYLLLNKDTAKQRRWPSQLLPNYLWYAIPAGLISLDDVPDYAGVIQIAIQKGLATTILRRAPLLHKNRVSDRLIRLLGHVAMYKIWNLYSEINQLKKCGNYENRS